MKDEMVVLLVSEDEEGNLFILVAELGEPEVKGPKFDDSRPWEEVEG